MLVFDSVSFRISSLLMRKQYGVVGNQLLCLEVHNSLVTRVRLRDALLEQSSSISSLLARHQVD